MQNKILPGPASKSSLMGEKRVSVFYRRDRIAAVLLYLEPAQATRQQRGWISKVSSVGELYLQLLRFMSPRNGGSEVAGKKCDVVGGVRACVRVDA